MQKDFPEGIFAESFTYYYIDVLTLLLLLLVLLITINIINRSLSLSRLIKI